MRTVIYKSYSFKDKDPIIDRLRTAFYDAQASDPELRKGGFAEVSRRSGLAETTPVAWFEGETKRPQFASVAAFARSIGYEIAVVKVDKGRMVQLTPVFRGGPRRLRIIARNVGAGPPRSRAVG